MEEQGADASVQRVTTVVLLVLCAQQSAQELMLQHKGAHTGNGANITVRNLNPAGDFLLAKSSVQLEKCITLKVITKAKSYEVARCRYVLNA